MGLVCYPETSVTKYQFAPHNIPEERRLHLHRAGRPKSRRLNCVCSQSRASPPQVANSWVNIIYVGCWNWSYFGLFEFTLLLFSFYLKLFLGRRCNCCLYVWDSLASWPVLLSPPTTAPQITKRYRVYRHAFVLQHQVESREIFLFYRLKPTKPNGHWKTVIFNTKPLNFPHIFQCSISAFLKLFSSGDHFH